MSPARAGYLALALLDTGLAAAGRSAARRASKPLLMPVLALQRDRPTQRALVLSGAGDVALLGDGDRAFTAGLASFLAAHLAWVSALRGRPPPGRRWPCRTPWRGRP